MGSVPLDSKMLIENACIAAELREKFRKHRVLVINLISSPGSGKSSLLEKLSKRSCRQPRCRSYQ